jgi:hypothetical protein
MIRKVPETKQAEGSEETDQQPNEEQEPVLPAAMCLSFHAMPLPVCPARGRADILVQPGRAGVDNSVRRRFVKDA